MMCMKLSWYTALDIAWTLMSPVPSVLLVSSTTDCFVGSCGVELVSNLDVPQLCTCKAGAQSKPTETDALSFAMRALTWLQPTSHSERLLFWLANNRLIVSVGYSVVSTQLVCQQKPKSNVLTFPGWIMYLKKDAVRVQVVLSHSGDETGIST